MAYIAETMFQKFISFIERHQFEFDLLRWPIGINYFQSFRTLGGILNYILH